MLREFIEVENSIHIEVNVIPTYLSFKGKIENVGADKFIVKINGHYVQNEPQVVTCTISNESKTRACIFKTIVVHVEKDELTLIMPKEEEVNIVQRREYIRVPENRQVNCYLIAINDRKVESDKIFPGVVKDISGGGVLLNSPLSPPIGTVLVFEIELDGTNFLLTIKVLRNLENEDGTRDLGCRFIGIDDSDRQKIIAYCAKRHLALMKKSKVEKEDEKPVP